MRSPAPSGTTHRVERAVVLHDVGRYKERITNVLLNISLYLYISVLTCRSLQVGTAQLINIGRNIFKNQS